MPEIVVPTPDENGNSRTWDKVFPIWGIEEPSEWITINSILESIAMNSRMGGKTPEELRAHLINYVTEGTKKELDENMAEMLASEGEMKKAQFGAAIVKNVDEKFLKARVKIFGEHGLALFYINEVFDNFGGAHREFK